MKFKWKGLKLNAFVEGEIESANKDDAMSSLKKDGVIVTEIIKLFLRQFKASEF